MSSPLCPTAIPPSPTSPPRSALKRRRLSENNPQSPVSPPFMSVATKSYVASYGNPQNTDEISGRSSPHSPSNSASRAHQPAPRTAPSLPTPANSVVGIPGLEMVEDGDQHRHKRPRLDAGQNNADTDNRMEVDSLPHATNHDRQQGMDVDNQSPDSELQRQMAREVGMQRDILEQQKDLGEPFLLRRSKIEAQGPDPQQHLLALYGLGPLLRSVARTDPKTGDKINKLRKSYEGQVKMFNLAGKTRTVKGDRNIDEDQPGPLRRMAGSSAWGLQSDEEWSAQHPGPKIEVTADFKAKLKRAAQIQPGICANNQFWENELGLSDKSRAQMQSAQVHTPQPGASRIPNGVQRPFSHQSAEPKRNTRGKKRSYSDDSFVGYGEGYSEGEDAGTGDEYGGSKKRRKEMAGGTPLAYGQYVGR